MFFVMVFFLDFADLLCFLMVFLFQGGHEGPRCHPFGVADRESKSGTQPLQPQRLERKISATDQPLHKGHTVRDHILSFPYITPSWSIDQDMAPILKYFRFRKLFSGCLYFSRIYLDLEEGFFPDKNSLGIP